MERPYIVECEDAVDYFNKVSNFGRRGWIYRGHSDVSWKLKSSLHRFLEIHSKIVLKKNWYAREREIIKRFQSNSHLYLKHRPEVKDFLQWLPIMQHYGCPTRLIDFTFNPTIALYFAIREAMPNKEFCVHALHIDTIRENSFYIRTEKNESIKKLHNKRNPRPGEYSIGEGKTESDFFGVVQVRLPNEREQAQEGVFVVPSKIDIDFENWIKSAKIYHKKIDPYSFHWVKFVFNNKESAYYDIIKQITQAGMSPLRLFPGLDGVGESLKYFWFEPIKDLDFD